jgi:KaiC/GvpD/RAD55 family RecA-like ATPase
MKEQEKRGAPRVAYVSDVVCEGEGTRLIARTSDISVSGVFIHSKLCCDAGSLLQLKFEIAATHIETVGEVCYSIPQVGMGVRFLDLKPEFRNAIAGLIEAQEDDSRTSAAHGRRITPSGVEPVDQLLGGLERGHLYLAHGDTAGKSLFGIQFLLEGLQNGQRVALITANLRVDAVRRFARLGYDCLGDIRLGNLVLFRSSPDLDDQVLRLGHLEPLLRDLEPVLAKSSPERIVFDPVNGLLAGNRQEDIASRAKELAVWLRSFGATVVLVANGENCDVIDSLIPAVKESFRFGVKENSDRVVRFIAFEKSPQLADQAVRVDPSRGISLLQVQTTGELLSQDPSPRVDSSSGPLDDSDTQIFSEIEEAIQSVEQTSTGDLLIPSPEETHTGGGLESNFNQDMGSLPSAYADQYRVDESEEACNEFFAMLDELQSFASSPDLEVTEKESDTIGSLNAQTVDRGTSAEVRRSIE